ncbi:MAG: hypothetical protein J6U19_02975, partial [Oscillospiraceae bacterium]|nr:hypothetical protein [Oscillospiraceae bacterium]
ARSRTARCTYTTDSGTAPSKKRRIFTTGFSIFAINSPIIVTGRVEVVLTIVGSVIVIFVLVNLFLQLKNSAEAKQLNRDLAQFQMLHE